LPSSRLIWAGPSATSIFASRASGTCAPLRAVITRLRIDSTSSRNCSGSRTTALKRRSPS
jgi:hypothetical protein